MVTVATTQKPSADVVPTFLRDLFGFRWALRCSTPQASDTILGSGWASRGLLGRQHRPGRPGGGATAPGGRRPGAAAGLLLDDLDLAELARRAELLRGTTRSSAPTLRLVEDEPA